MVETEKEPRFINLHDAIKIDERGLIYFPFQGEVDQSFGWEVLESFHLVSLLPGQTRGNHLHPNKIEWLYVFNGEGQFYWTNDQGQLRQKLLQGDQTMVIIPPGIPHALKNDRAGVLYLLAWRVAEEEDVSAPDTIPEAII
jgi:quercetin dioxygenase-like cupin family protein